MWRPSDTSAHSSPGCFWPCPCGDFAGYFYRVRSCPLYPMIFSSIPGNWPLGTSSTAYTLPRLPRLCWPKPSSDIAKYPLGNKIAPGWEPILVCPDRWGQFSLISFVYGPLGIHEFICSGWLLLTPLAPFLPLQGGPREELEQSDASIAGHITHIGFTENMFAWGKFGNLGWSQCATARVAEQAGTSLNPLHCSGWSLELAHCLQTPGTRFKFSERCSWSHSH